MHLTAQSQDSLRTATGESTNGNSHGQRSRSLLAYLTLVIAYVVTGKLALLLALPPGYASAIFPPAGIAVAAALIGGYRTLPWTLLGSLLLNLWVGYSPTHPLTLIGSIAASVIALASMLQAAVGEWLLRRTIGYPCSFDKASDVLRFLLLAPAICLVSASLSVSSLCLLGIFDSAQIPTAWAAWWIGDTLGVIVMLPLIFVAAGEPRDLWRSRELTVAVPMLLAFALFVFVFVKANRWEHEESLMEFRAQSQQIADQIQTRFEEQEFLLEEVEGFLSHDFQKPTTRDEFRRFVGNSLIRFPALYAMEWAPLVERSQRERFEARQRTDLPDFEIRERNSAGQLDRAADRPYYYPISFVEPVSVNRAAIGFDLASMDDRLKTLNSARERKTPVATPPLRLVQEDAQQLGILLMLAVNRGGNAPGIALTALRVADFLDKTLPHNRSAFRIRMTDVAAQQIIYDNFDAATNDTPLQHILNYGTRQYRLEFVPTELYLTQHRGWQSWMVLAVGLFGTGLLGALLLLGTGHTARVEAMVRDRTTALERESFRNRLFLRNASEGIHILDADGNVVEASDAFGAMLGYSRQELLGMNVAQWDAGLGSQHVIEEVRRLQGRTEAPTAFETKHRCHDGSVIDVEVFTIGFESDGKSLLFASSRDITERKRAETDLLRTEAQLKEAQRMAKIGSWELDLLQDRLTWSEEIYRIFEIDPAAFGASYGAFMEAIHPDDRDRVDSAYKASLQDKLPYEIDHRLLFKDGRIKYVHERCETFYDSDGKPLRSIGTVQDVTLEKLNEEALRESEARFRTVADYNYDWEYWLGPDMQYLYLSPSCERITGYPQSEFMSDIGLAERIVHPADRDRIATHLEDYRDEAEHSLDFRIIAKDGGIRWIAHGCRPVFGKNGEFMGRRVSNRDITERKAIEAVLFESEEKFRLISSVAKDAIVIVGPDEEITYWNPAAEVIFGYGADEVLGRNMHDFLIPTRYRESAHRGHEQYRTSGQGQVIGKTFEIDALRKSGEEFPVELSISALQIKDRWHALGIIRDITERKNAEEQIRQLAYYDTLTNLPNRRLLLDRINQSLTQAARYQRSMAVMFLDLDRFKAINDKLGHEVGDELLKAAALRLNSCVRTGDTVSRQGGDEFVIVLAEINQQQDAARVAEKIIEAFALPVVVSGKELMVTISVGIAVYQGSQPDDAQGLLKKADMAMYAVKGAGRNGYRFYQA